MRRRPGLFDNARVSRPMVKYTCHRVEGWYCTERAEPSFETSKQEKEIMYSAGISLRLVTIIKIHPT